MVSIAVTYVEIAIRIPPYHPFFVDSQQNELAFSSELRNEVESGLRCDLHQQITFNFATTGETYIIWGYTGCIENAR
jgi:hypothetical protein